MIDLSSIPRVRLAHLPTPLEPLERLSSVLGGPRLWIKRDDCTGLSTGGNKTRKLEFLLADALKVGADTIVTAGATQSNHTRQTAAAAARYGLKCHLLHWNISGISGHAYRENGNVLLNRLHGATIHELSGDGARSEIGYLNDEIDRLVHELSARGARPYAIPVGASNAIGALGYVNCAFELLSQAKAHGLNIDAVVHKSGSAGTQAGLIAGFRAMDSPVRVLGIGGGKAPANLEEVVFQLAEESASLLGLTRQVNRSDVVAADPNVTGYGLLTGEVAEAIRLLASVEGILLDPVYTGRAMVALIDLIRRGSFESDANVVFLHTGGIASLFGYADSFENLAMTTATTGT